VIVVGPGGVEGLDHDAIAGHGTVVA